MCPQEYATAQELARNLTGVATRVSTRRCYGQYSFEARLSLAIAEPLGDTAIMPKKKITARKSKAPKKAAGKKKVTSRSKIALRAKPARKKKAARKVKSAPAKRPTPIKKARSASGSRRSGLPVRREISSGSERSSLGSGPFSAPARPLKRGLGDEAAGQSGDLQGLSSSEDVDSESVEELLEEGQAFEAEVVSGVENAPDPDEEEVHTHERPEDEIPPVDQA